MVRHQSARCSGSCRRGHRLPALAAILFITAGIAENKRIPFDLPEAESELISGYFTEYSAMKQACSCSASSSRSP